jgi:channel protein (hemolysin III family)
MGQVAVDSPETLQELFRLPQFYEPFSAMSHLFGTVLFLWLGALLLRRGRGDRARLAYLSIYAASCVLLFTMSGLYHTAVRGGAVRQVFERLDHGAIFLLVAGTFTPVHGLLFQGWLRWGPLVGIWAAAITGITLKTIYFTDLAEWLGLTFYLAMGWVGVIFGVILARRYGYAFVRPLLWGGIAYSAGAVMEFLGGVTLVPRVVHAHEVFHLAVLAGAILHWRFVWTFATGAPQLGRNRTPVRTT